MKCSVFTTNQWKNREPLKDYSAPVHTRGRSLQPSDVIYTLHIPSFSNGTTGTAPIPSLHTQVWERINPPRNSFPTWPISA